MFSNWRNLAKFKSACKRQVEVVVPVVSTLLPLFLLTQAHALDQFLDPAPLCQKGLENEPS